MQEVIRRYLSAGKKAWGPYVSETYSDPDDKNLLYVECTRALHRLSLMSEGKQAVEKISRVC